MDGWVGECMNGVTDGLRVLQMSAVYWALMGMALMGRDLEAEMDLGKIVEWVLECQHPNGGYVRPSARPCVRACVRPPHRPPQGGG